MANEYSASIYIQPSFQNYSNNSKPIKTHYAGLMSVQHQKIPTFGKKPRFGLNLGLQPTKPKTAIKPITMEAILDQIHN